MIPVFEPDIGEEEVTAVVAAIRRGEISGSFGKSIEEFETGFAAYCDCRFGVAVTSGTTALHLAVAALDLKPDDEVLLSSSTNIATALAVIYANAIPIPVDSEKETWNLDLDLIEDLITPRTRAIIPVHLFGHPVDMDRLVEIAREHNLAIIEDCAEAHGARCRDRMVGGLGNMGCFSFYSNKVITTGEGGMVVTNDEALAKKLKLLRNLGFTEPRYRHEVAGFNFRMTAFQAAFGTAQLQKIDRVIEKKRRLAQTYSRYLADVPGLQLPAEMQWAFNVYWMYALTVGPPYPISRDELAASLRREGIDTRTFFCPMNRQPCLQSRPGYRDVPCPVADELWRTGLYLPSTTNLAEDQIVRICGEIRRAANG
jgi:perosamine synthetase